MPILDARASRSFFSSLEEEAREELASPDSLDCLGFRAFGAESDFIGLDVLLESNTSRLCSTHVCRSCVATSTRIVEGFRRRFVGTSPAPTLETRMCFTTLATLLLDCERSIERCLLVRNRHDNRVSDIPITSSWREPGRD